MMITLSSCFGETSLCLTRLTYGSQCSIDLIDPIYIYICLYQLDLGLVVLFNFYLFDPCSIREMIIILSAQIWSDQNGHSVHYPIADATLQTLIRWSCILDSKLSPFFPMEYCYHDPSSVRTCIYWFFWGPWILSCCFRSSTTKRKRIVRRVVAWIVLCFVSRWN